MRVIHWHALLVLGWLAASWATAATGGAGLSSSSAVPAQVIIQFYEKPAALRLPTSLNSMGSSQRVKSAALASAAASAEQASFRAAAAGIAFRTDHVYTHVCVTLPVLY